MVARFVLATVFLSSGIAKLPRRREFVDAVRDYELVPEQVAVAIGRLLPAGEVLIGALLFTGVALLPAAAITGGVLGAFSIAIAMNLLRGREIACGCFGLVAEARLGWSSVLRNFVLIAAAVLVGWRPVATLSPEPAGRAVASGTGLAALIIGTLAALAYSLVREALRLRKLLGARS